MRVECNFINCCYRIGFGSDPTPQFYPHVVAHRLNATNPNIGAPPSETDTGIWADPGFADERRHIEAELRKWQQLPQLPALTGRKRNREV